MSIYVSLKASNLCRVVLKNLLNTSRKQILTPRQFLSWIYRRSESALEKKGNFSYSYVDSVNKLNDATLPSFEKWKNSLKENKVEIIQHDLDQLKKCLVSSTAKT